MLQDESYSESIALVKINKFLYSRTGRCLHMLICIMIIQKEVIVVFLRLFDYGNLTYLNT